MRAAVPPAASPITVPVARELRWLKATGMKTSVSAAVDSSGVGDNATRPPRLAVVRSVCDVARTVSAEIARRKANSTSAGAGDGAGAGSGAGARAGAGGAGGSDKAALDVDPG